jgi:hypothetical protein
MAIFNSYVSLPDGRLFKGTRYYFNRAQNWHRITRIVPASQHRSDLAGHFVNMWEYYLGMRWRLKMGITMVNYSML